MLVEYIGHPFTYWDATETISQELVTNEQYEIEIQYDGPQIIINGQPVISPEGNMWVNFTNGVCVPYAPAVLEKFWKIS